MMNYLSRLFLIISFIVLGCMCGLYYHYSITKTNSVVSVSSFHDQKQATLFFYDKKGCHEDTISFFGSEVVAQDCFYLISQWLMHAWHKRFIDVPIKCESVIIDPEGTTIFVSFDYSFLNKEWPIFVKINVINSVLKTLHTYHQSLQYVYFLVRHEPFVDPHIDSICPFASTGY